MNIPNELESYPKFKILREESHKQYANKHQQIFLYNITKSRNRKLIFWHLEYII